MSQLAHVRADRDPLRLHLSAISHRLSQLAQENARLQRENERLQTMNRWLTESSQTWIRLYESALAREAASAARSRPQGR